MCGHHPKSGGGGLRNGQNTYTTGGGGVLQHITSGVLGTSTNTKSRFSCAGTTRKVGEGVLGTDKTRERGIKKWYYEKRGY